MTPAVAAAVVDAVVVVAVIALPVKSDPQVPLLLVRTLTKRKKTRLRRELGNGWKKTTRISRM